jgi:hypothetical protein
LDWQKKLVTNDCKQPQPKGFLEGIYTPPQYNGHFLSFLKENIMEDKIYLGKAIDPNDLGIFFVSRANAGDVDGLVALYEQDAVLVINKEGKIAKGHQEIGVFYANMLRKKPIFEKGKQKLALRNGDLALTSSRLVNGTITAEVARLQPDNTWLWIIDEPNM